jgi:phosphomannomutase/phosphoglucomutase
MAKKRPAKNQNDKNSNPLLSALATVALGVSLVAAFCFAYLVFVERPANDAERLALISERHAETQAVVIDQALQQMQRRLQVFADAPELKMALVNKDVATTELFRRQLQHSFPEAVSTLLIELGPLGIASLDTGSLSLRNNIELDLLRRASNGETVAPEAYLADTQWIFSLAQAVQSKGERYARAALFISLDGKFLKQLLASSDGGLGETQLIQRFSNKSNTIARHGQAGGAVVAQIDTSIPSWDISFSPSAKLRDSMLLGATSLWVVLGIIVITVLLLAAYAIRQLSSYVQSLPAKKEAAQPVETPAVEEPAPEPLLPEATLEEPEPELTLELDEHVIDQLPADLPAHIFRAYDIRGIADSELTDEIVHAIAMAIGSEALDQGQQKVVVAMDGRESSPRIKAAMIRGLQESGRDVIDIGMVPTPLMYFATHHLGTQTGVMITGSHNPGEYNGIKIVIGGRALSGPAIANLRERVVTKQIADGSGDCQSAEVTDAYVDRIINDIAVAQPLKVVLDAGNGVAGVIAPRLFEELGCEVIPLYCDVDGSFPNHHPDPTVEANLADMKAAIAEHGADLGIAFDGDGDRLGVVTATGQSVPADRLLMLLAQDVVSRNPGADILFDVKCTRNLNALISNYGGRPIMWKTGHSFMKEKMAETGALLGGEFSGHIFFKERWFGFDDGLYSGTRLIEILSTTDPDLDAQLEAFPESIGSPELKVESDDEQKFTVIEQLASLGQFGDGKITTLDGVRVDFADGWGLVRASNTTPMLILRFEADTEEAMSRIQSLFKEQLLSVDNSLQFGF